MVTREKERWRERINELDEQKGEEAKRMIPLYKAHGRRRRRREVSVLSVLQWVRERGGKGGLRERERWRERWRLEREERRE